MGMRYRTTSQRGMASGPFLIFSLVRSTSSSTPPLMLIIYSLLPDQKHIGGPFPFSPHFKGSKYTNNWLFSLCKFQQVTTICSPYIDKANSMHCSMSKRKEPSTYSSSCGLCYNAHPPRRSTGSRLWCWCRSWRWRGCVGWGKVFLDMDYNRSVLFCEILRKAKMSSNPKARTMH